MSISDMTRDEYMAYMEVRLAEARAKRRARHRAFMDDYMAWRNGGGVVLSAGEAEIIIRALSDRVASCPDLVNKLQQTTNGGNN